MDELSQLNVILKNSFAGIKSDMSEIKDKQEQTIAGSFKIKQDVEQIKEEYVSKDKLNALKIKVGEINDTLKRIWDIESSIKTIDSKKTNKDEFEERFSKLRDEITKKLSEMNSSTNKRLVEYSNAINKNIETVNNNSAKVFSKISQQMASVVTKSQLKEFTADVSNELFSMKTEVAEIRKIKDAITASELEKRTGLLNARVDLLAKELIRTNQTVARYITSEEVKTIIEAVNREFDSIRNEVSEVTKLKRYIGLVESESLSKKDFSKEISDVNLNIESAKKEIRLLRDDSRAYVRYADIEKSMKSMESLLTRKILDLEKEVISLKRFERRHENEFIQEAKKIEKIEKAQEKPKMEVKVRSLFEKERKPINFLPFLSVLSILLIVSAFAGIAGAIIAYFALEPVWTNYLTIGAVVAFVLGIVLRVIVVKKRR